MNDTLTPEDKVRLNRYVRAHQYDPPPLRQWMRDNWMRNGVYASLFVWGHLWLFSRIWRLVVKYGTLTR